MSFLHAAPQGGKEGKISIGNKGFKHYTVHESNAQLENMIKTLYKEN